jgi:hypothetical protein
MKRRVEKAELLGALSLATAALCMPAHATQTAATPNAGGGAEALVVVRDATTGRLRAPTAEEAQQHASRVATDRSALARGAAVRPTEQALVRRHSNGAKSVRMTDEMVSQVVAVRRGSQVEAHCVPDKAAAQATVAFTAGPAKE